MHAPKSGGLNDQSRNRAPWRHGEERDEGLDFEKTVLLYSVHFLPSLFGEKIAAVCTVQSQ